MKCCTTLLLASCAALLCCLIVLAEAAPRKHTVQVVKGVKSDPGKVRVCVINGMIRTGMWQAVSKMFEERTGLKVVVVATGPKTVISRPFRRGEADLLTMHSSDGTTDLVVEGYGINMRPWTRNDLVILGPPHDPAGIRGLTDGAEAFKRIADTKSAYVDIMGPGKREVCHKLWGKNGIRPRGPWVLKDESPTRHKALLYASEKKAYIVFGRVPVLWHKVSYGNLEVMVKGDPAMRRPYMVMEANPEVFPGANHAGARALSDFLLSEEVQTFLGTFGRELDPGIPLFHPVWPYNDKKTNVREKG